MTTLNITVFNNKVLIDNPVVIPEGNYNTIFALFDLPDEWNGLTAKVKFGNVTPITIPSSKTVAIPLFDIKGDVTVKVFAYSLVNDEYLLIHSPAPSQLTICEGSFDNDGETPVPPTPETEYLDKATLWGGYSAYFSALTDAPADAVAEFESVDITSMTLEEVVTEIEVINKMILDAHTVTIPVEDVKVDGVSVVENKIANISFPNVPVKDVKVNGASVVESEIANISVPTNNNQLTNGAGYQTASDVTDYINNLKGKLDVPAPSNIFNLQAIDITDKVKDNYLSRDFIEANGNLNNTNTAYRCFKCDLSQFKPTQIRTSSRSSSYLSFAFYSSDTDFNSGTFLGGGKNTLISTSSSDVKFETLYVNNIPDGARTMLITYYASSSEFKVIGYKNAPPTVSRCINQWDAVEKPNSLIIEHSETPTHYYRVGANRTYPNLITAVAAWVADEKPCAVIYVDNGTYITSSDPTGSNNALTIVGGVNNLTIVGEDTDSTIVKSTTGKYIQPPIYIVGGNVIIKNITFIADHTDNSGFKYFDPDRAAQGKTPNSAYAVHCDTGTIPGVIKFENCKMWSWQSCGLGCGTVKNGHIIVENCDIRSFVPGALSYSGAIPPVTDEDKEQYALYEHGARGALVYHPSSTTDYSTESFTLINSYIYLLSGRYTAKISSGSNKYVLLTFVDNLFYNEAEDYNRVNLSLGYLNSLSVGNNIDVLNSNNINHYLYIEVDNDIQYVADYVEDVKVNGTSAVDNNKVADISVPTSLSQLTSDSTHRVVSDTDITTWNGKANVSDIPTNNNQLTNGAGYQTAADVATAISGKENVSNKVTTIDTTSPSNTNYPSESAVVTYMNNVVGAINTTLDDINGVVI